MESNGGEELDSVHRAGERGQRREDEEEEEARSKGARRGSDEERPPAGKVEEARRLMLERGAGKRGEEGAREEDRPLDEVDEEGERPRPAHSRGVTCGSGSRLVGDGAAWFPPIAGATLGRKKKGKKGKRKKGMPIPKRRRRWKERRERGEARKGGRQERARVSSWSSVPWTTPPEG